MSDPGQGTVCVVLAAVSSGRQRARSSEEAGDALMLLFIVGVLLGAGVTYLGLTIIGRSEAQDRRRDDALLRSHVRSLLALVDRDLLHPDNPESQDLVRETRSLLVHESHAPRDRAPRVLRATPAVTQDDEANLAPIFRRNTARHDPLPEVDETDSTQAAMS